MTEWILRDTAAAYADFDYTVLRYFNVAGADPLGRIGQRTRGATHLLKVACEAAVGRRPAVEIYGTDWPTPDGTGVRDFIADHVIGVYHTMDDFTGRAEPPR